VMGGNRYTSFCFDEVKTKADESTCLEEAFVSRDLLLIKKFFK